MRASANLAQSPSSLSASPEEKPAEAYIKLTNASLRDQNPDDDEEEDEYYKWKAAKANQVAPEP